MYYLTSQILLTAGAMSSYSKQAIRKLAHLMNDAWRHLDGMMPRSDRYHEEEDDFRYRSRREEDDHRLVFFICQHLVEQVNLVIVQNAKTL